MKFVFCLLGCLACNVIAQGADNNVIALGADNNVITTENDDKSTIEELQTEVSYLTATLGHVMTQLGHVMTHLKELRHDVDNKAESIGTSYYIWGRNECPVNAARVFSGKMANSHDYEPAVVGGGTDWQCMPFDPQYANYQDGDDAGSYVWGTEYAGNADFVFDTTNLQDTTFIGNDVPCSLCYVTNRTTVQMLAAQTVCPLGWTQEYWGYLVSTNADTKTPSTYACLEHAPEAAYGGGDVHTYVSHVYTVEMKCGYAFECPSYIDGRELTCSVCTR